MFGDHLRLLRFTGAQERRRGNERGDANRNDADE
jgi:hypothetical protein